MGKGTGLLARGMGVWGARLARVVSFGEVASMRMLGRPRT